jgi:hypothetical protein
MVCAYADLHPFGDPLTWATKSNLTEQHLTSMGDVQGCPSQSCSKAWAGLGITFSGGRRMLHCSICCCFEQRVCHTLLRNIGAQYVPLKFKVELHCAYKSIKVVSMKWISFRAPWFFSTTFFMTSLGSAILHFGAKVPNHKSSTMTHPLSEWDKGTLHLRSSIVGYVHWVSSTLWRAGLHSACVEYTL